MATPAPDLTVAAVDAALAGASDGTAVSARPCLLLLLTLVAVLLLGRRHLPLPSSDIHDDEAPVLHRIWWWLDRAIDALNAACLVLSVFIYGLAVDIALTAALPLRAVSLRAWYALDHFFYLPVSYTHLTLPTTPYV